MILARKVGCRHPSTTLVQAATTIDYDPDIKPFNIWFAAYQCDSCGRITQQEVTAEEVEEASEAPWLDEEAYLSSMKISLEGEVEWTALKFMEKAVRR